MSEQQIKVTKTLPFGLPGKDGGEPIRRVVFAKRPTAGDQIKIEDDVQAAFDIQKSLMYARTSIVEFGDKQRQPHLTELLSLKRPDRETIIEGYIEFLTASIGDRTQEKIDDDTLKLAFGLIEEGETYDLVTLCDKSSELTGYEELELERSAKGDFEQLCMLLGRDVAQLSSESGRVIEGPLGIEQIRKFDFFDLSFMRVAAGERRLLFRNQGAGLQADAGAAGVVAGA
jgi:hypothetical protein